MQDKRYCDTDQEPSRDRVGTVRRVTFQDGSRARMTHPFTMEEAILFFDPFQARTQP